MYKLVNVLIFIIISIIILIFLKLSFGPKKEISRYDCGMLETPEGNFIAKVPFGYNTWNAFDYHITAMIDNKRYSSRRDNKVRDQLCYYPVETIRFNYLWPDLTPAEKSKGFIKGLISLFESNKTIELDRSLIQAYITPEWKEYSSANLKGKHRIIKKLFFKRMFMFGWNYFESSYDEFDDVTNVIKEAKYDPELNVYRAERIELDDRENAIENYYSKTEFFWELDENKDIDVLIICRYAHEALKTTFEESRCRHFRYNDEYYSTLQIIYSGEHFKDWRKIDSESEKLLHQFITQKVATD